MPQFTTSVLMSLFFKENPAYLDAAFESLYKQSVPATEIILVCEGDIKGELEIILNKWLEKFTNSVLKIIDAGDAKGLPACLNVGLQLAKGDYIIRFDTDDYCCESRIEKQLDFFKHNTDVVLLSATMEEYDNSLKELLAVRKVPLNHNDILSYAQWRNPFNHPSIAYKRDVALKLGGYPLVGSNEDYAFFCNFLIHQYKTANLEEVIVKARAGKELAKRRSGKKYLQGEIECLQYIHQIGFYSTPRYYFHLVAKKIIRNLPSFLVGGIYKKLLR
jgi:glycosyltransferase involved in cell wall biosynthesis